jgi:deoxyribonuclease V
MIACLDVHYFDKSARAAAVVFQDWHSTSVASAYTAITPDPGEYEPGRFYLRELQPLLAVVSQIVESIDAYVIDGYCHLSADGTPGLGEYLKESLPQPVAIIGVAKNRYRDTTHAVEVCRAESTRPLFVTAIGIDYESAATRIASMSGEFRIPMMLKFVDRLARHTAV